MPVVTLTLDETSKSIKTAMYQSLVKDIVDSLGVRYDHLSTVFSGMEVSKTDNTTNVSMQTQSNLPSTVSQRRVIARVVSRYDEDSITSTVVSQRDVPDIYRDRTVDTAMFPVYVKSDTTITIEYTTPSEAEAERLLDDIRIKLSQGRNILHHDVEFNIILPKEAENFITDVYDLKSRLVPGTLAEYTGEFVTPRMHLITDLTSDKNARIAVRERQVRIVGTFDFSPLPEECQKDKDNNTYKLTIPYKVKLDIPTALCLCYPTMVANRPMPAKYLRHIEEIRTKNRQEWARSLEYSRSGSAYAYFEAHRQLDYRIRTDLPINLPIFDQWAAPKLHAGYVPICTILCSVDETDKRTLFNLKEIDTYFSLDSDFLSLFSDEIYRRGLVKPYESVFYFGLHQNNKYFDRDLLSIDADLNVKATKDLTLLKAVHVSLGICIDPTMLRTEGFERIKRNTPMFLYYLTEMVNARVNFSEATQLTGLTDEHLMKILLDMLIRSCKAQDGDFIKEVFRILGLDSRFAVKLSTLIRVEYPQLYTCLSKFSNIADYHDHTTHMKNFTVNDNYKMRTVLTSYVDVRASSGVLGGSSKKDEPNYYEG